MMEELKRLRGPKEMIMSLIAAVVIGGYVYKFINTGDIDVQDMKEIVLMVLSYYYGSKNAATSGK
jgi:uncharacterized protein Smg (DUF494 family)